VNEPIRFYSKTPAYREFSNFAPCGFEEDGLYWPTVEHYFQAQKFSGADNAAYREKIRAAKTPREAKALGRTRSIVIRPDWEQVKDRIMLAALRKKFAVGELRELLLSTGERPLVEASPSDSYWGCGRSGTGKNRLGALLMQVRAELRDSTAVDSRCV
jgi:N-glycosidase YbiA